MPGSCTRRPTRCSRSRPTSRTVPVEELYEACRAARGLLTGEDAVARVIARPFEGEPGAYVRTVGRHDFSLAAADAQLARSSCGTRGVTVQGVGKISDIFAGEGIDHSTPTSSNGHGLVVTTRAAPRGSRQHLHLHQPGRDRHAVGPSQRSTRASPTRWRRSMRRCPTLMAALRHGDLLILTSDHGCDPTTAVHRPLSRVRAAARPRPRSPDARPPA